jgi:hypothetical protein
VLDRNGNEFCSGLARFKDHLRASDETTAKIFVKVDIGNFGGTIFAELDTGAAWSILAPEIADLLGIETSEGELVTMSTRLGRLQGHLVKIPVRFVADEGRSLEFDGTFFISPEWSSGLSFLGYSGLLDSIRFAVDAPANQFYFGRA